MLAFFLRGCHHAWFALRPAPRRTNGRATQALGHTVRLMSPAHVKPYVKRQKNDMADAEAICEAGNMRFVPTRREARLSSNRLSIRLELQMSIP